MVSFSTCMLVFTKLTSILAMISTMTCVNFLFSWTYRVAHFFEPTQFSQYGVAPATLTKAKISVATIGGEPGGRAAIVVEDKLGQNANIPPAEEQHTSIFVGKAEPGRDIFAGEPVKDIKSQSLPPPRPPPPVEEVKEISSVLTRHSIASAEKQEKGGEYVQGSSSLSTSSGVGSTEAQGTVVKPAAVIGESDRGVKKPAGPLVEAEVEADKVAQELYPEAVAKK